jgi:hypothetical protein
VEIIISILICDIFPKNNGHDNWDKNLGTAVQNLFWTFAEHSTSVQKHIKPRLCQLHVELFKLKKLTSDLKFNFFPSL